MDAEGIPKEKRPLIIPKIEKPAALKNIDEILALSDGSGTRRVRAKAVWRGVWLQRVGRRAGCRRDSPPALRPSPRRLMVARGDVGVKLGLPRAPFPPSLPPSPGHTRIPPCF